MIAKAVSRAALALAAGLAMVAGMAGAADASDRDRKFFTQIQGEWNGPGEIVAGKYKGTRFNCSFTGTTPDGKIGMALDGGCRMGLFTQRMSANVELAGSQGYRGTFMDGAEGEGLDVTDGQVEEGKVTFALNRNALNGVMLASLPSADAMHVTVSVRVEDQMVPVIGMWLKRVDNRAVGSVSD